MPLGTIPPWLNIGPTDYLHAIQAGTQAGLEVNRQRALAEEAAARRELAQQEAQRQAWEFGETMRQRAAQQAAEQALEREKLAQTGTYQTGLLDWHNEQARLANEKALQQQQYQGDVLDLRSKHYNDLMNYREETQKYREEKDQALQDLREKSFELRQKAAEGRLSPEDKALLDADVAKLKEIEKKAAEMDVHGFGLFHPLGGNKSEYEDLNKQAATLRGQIGSGANYRGASSPQLGNLETDPAYASRTVSPVTQSPYREGTILRKKDGSRWIIRNGEPVPYTSEEEF